MSGLQSLCFCPNPSTPPLPRPQLAGANLSPKPATVTPPITSSSSTTLPVNGPLLHGLPSQVKEKILCLEIMGIDSEKALSANPSLHEATPDSINSIVSYLQSKGIHQKDLGRILGMCPMILTADFRLDLAPVFRFLSHELGVRESNFRKVINKCPRLLVSSVPDQLRPAHIYLQRLGFHDSEALAYHDPVLLVSSVERTLMPKLVYLQDGMGFARDEAVAMVLRCPGLFTFSIENNFKPKHAYFVEEMQGNMEEIGEFPQYFAFSLEKRIKPRHQQLLASGASLPLSLMLKTTDEEFRELIQDGVEKSPRENNN